MQDNRRHTPRFYRALKTIFAAALGEYGGSAAAEAIVRTGRQTLDKCTSLRPENAERFATLDVVADLDTALAESGARPVVSEYLAAISGYVLVPAPAGTTPLAEAVTSLRRAGAFIEDAARALQDGQIDAAERVRLRARACACSEQFVALIAALDNADADAEGAP